MPGLLVNGTSASQERVMCLTDARDAAVGTVPETDSEDAVGKPCDIARSGSYDHGELLVHGQGTRRAPGRCAYAQCGRATWCRASVPAVFAAAVCPYLVRRMKPLGTTSLR